jgi:hypothetical protein
VKHNLPNLTAVFLALILAGCVSVDEAPTASPAKPTAVSKAPVKVTAKLLTYRDVQDFAEKHPELNERLKTLAPSMAYHEGQSKADVIPLIADAAGFAAQEILNWVGNRLEDEAKKHSAQFAAFVQQPDWWSQGQPEVAAVELTRTQGDGPSGETLFDAIVLIRPVFGAMNQGIPKLAAFQLVPVYLLETKPAAEDFGKTMGAVLSVTVECTWASDKGAPKSAVLANYTETLDEYEVGQPLIIAANDELAQKDAKSPLCIRPSDASHFFAMPERAATIGVTFCVAEADPSKWVGILAKLGAAISGQAGNANDAVKNKLNPPST